MQQLIAAVIRWGGRRGDRGASLVEYAFLLALLALVSIAALGFLGTAASESYDANTSSMFVRP